MSNESFTYFKRRRLADIADKMNKRVRILVPGLQKNIFVPCRSAPDGQEFAVFPECTGVDIDQKIIDQVFSEYNAEIDKAVACFNPFSQKIAEIISLIFWETAGVFRVNNVEPFTLANNSRSPIYIDNGSVTTWPAFMNLISSGAQFIFQMELGEIDVIVGGETRGIIFGSWVAKDSGKGAGIARKMIKAHGTGQGVEGNIKPGERVVIGEDLITDGRSKVPFIKHLRAIGAEIVAIVVIFDREQGGPEFIKKEFGLDVYSLTNISIHLEVGLANGYINNDEYRSIKKYLEDPKAWNEARGYEWPVAS